MSLSAINTWRRRLLAGIIQFTNNGEVGPVLGNDPAVSATVAMIRGTQEHGQSYVMVGLNAEANNAPLAMIGAGGYQMRFYKSSIDKTCQLQDGDDVVFEAHTTNAGLVSYVFPYIREYADEAAADADDTLKSKSLYKLTGDRGIYQKP